MSAFWEKKMATYFTRIDFDKDGAITLNDFEAMAARFIASEKLDAKRGADLKEKLVQLWEKYLKPVAGGKPLTKDVFIAAIKKQVNDKDLSNTVAGPLPIFFKAVDGNADGAIQVEEYETFFSILGLDPKLAKVSFEAIDTNHDGSLSEEEFVTAGTQFFTSEDATSPSQFFWGPLV